jgi:hypothetical protein
MLIKITDHKLLSMQEAVLRYPTKYFKMLITERVDTTGQRDKGYVLYTADTRQELLDIPHEELYEKRVASLHGDDVPEAKSLGDVVYYGA